MSNGVPTVSMLDLDTLSRDVTNCIATFPVTARHRGKTIKVRMMATQNLTEAIEGGTWDNVSLGVIANSRDFGMQRPKSMDDFDILFGRKWVRFQIRNVPDYYDSLSPMLTINLQTVQRGIA
jgi:hypothetical protein